MTAINHALTGTAIGLLIGQPLLAAPLAVGSHFLCDALPHYDSDPPGGRITSRTFRYYLVTDAALCCLLVVVLAVLQPVHWQLAAVCAFLAASPDFLWVNRYRAVLRHKPWRPGLFSRFASAIQWFAKPIGAVFEAAWFMAALAIIIPFLH